jgi:hypothetical protein
LNELLEGFDAIPTHLGNSRGNTSWCNLWPVMRLVRQLVGAGGYENIKGANERFARVVNKLSALSPSLATFEQPLRAQQ